MKAYFRLAVSAAASILVPICAFGQWTASAYIGKTHTSDADIQAIAPPDTNISFHNVGFDDRSFDRPLYYGVRVGYLFTPNVGFEGEFIHNKVYGRVDEPVGAGGTLSGTGRVAAVLPPSIVIQRYNVSHGLNLLLGNFVLRRQLIPRLNAAFRAGLGAAIAHPEIQAFGATVDEYQVKSAAIQLGGGVELTLTRRLFWLGEYKFTATDPRFTVGSGTVENSFQTHHFVTGLGVRF